MKVNEKNLAMFATSASTPVDREGWLVKRGEINKAFQKRWFVLKGNLLFYFEKKSDKEPTGFIVLEGCTVELAEDEGQFGFKIVFHGQGNRTYVLEADSQDSMEQWMKALASASYDYIKCMVSELERQLQEMEKVEKIGPLFCWNYRNIYAVVMLSYLYHCQNAKKNVPVYVGRFSKVVVPSVNVRSLNDGDDGAAGSHPVAPPRTRHNPFNRPAPQSHRNVPVRVDTDVVRSKTWFRDVHNAYGRIILKQFTEWKHEQRQLQQPLIEL